MDADVAVALGLGIVGVMISVVALLETRRANKADYEARKIDRAASRLEAFEGIHGSEDMALIQEYKTKHGERGYYEHFRRNFGHDKDIARIEVARSRLAKFWKSTIHLYEQQALPDNFLERGDWLRWGDRYRQLVEPLDVARYYREGFFDENQKEYDQVKNRPRQYRFLLEKWEQKKDPDEEVKMLMTRFVEIEKTLRAAPEGPAAA